MAELVKILTKHQEQFLGLVAKERYFCEHFYLTGGTALAAFYLHHRYSEDIDLFSEEEFDLSGIRSFVGKTQKILKLEKVDYRQYYGLHIFELFFPGGNVLKVDFNYYPFGQIEKSRLAYMNLFPVDSVIDIAANKVQTIATKPRARDFIDLYYIIQKYNYSMNDLLVQARAKFDWHIDRIQLGSRFLMVSEIKDFPHMIQTIKHEEWQKFFLEEAKNLKPDIIS
jgi:predicted nucleotidyltransferase component of viral defense system